MSQVDTFTAKRYLFLLAATASILCVTCDNGVEQAASRSGEHQQEAAGNHQPSSQEVHRVFPVGEGEEARVFPYQRGKVGRKGSGHCSICKNVLLQDSAAQQENIHTHTHTYCYQADSDSARGVFPYQRCKVG